MLNAMLTCVANVTVIVAAGVSVHYLGGLDWPWATLIGAAVLVALRWLLRSVGTTRTRKPPLTGGG